MAEPTLPLTGSTSDGAPVAISEIGLGHLTQLAGWDGFDAAARTTLGDLGLPLPTDYRTTSQAANASAYRIAPNRVLVRSDASPTWQSSHDIAVLDLTDARRGFTLSGQGATGLLSRVITLDLSTVAFPVGTFAQTALHHVGVLIERQGSDRFTLFIPTTWARSLIGFIAAHLDTAH